MQLLITGGAGYIGTHTCVELLDQGHQIVVIDNFSNSSAIALQRVAEITEKKLVTTSSESGDIIFYNADIRDRDALRNILKTHKIDAAMHFAGLKAVGESVNKPLEYYDNNVTGSITLFQELANANVKNIIFSSSATVYGAPKSIPIKESFPVGGVTNPYGEAKLFTEYILKDIRKADSSWKIGILRYFNPIGAHPSGAIGEDPNGIPNNLMPFISQVAVGKLDKLRIFGDDYPTTDGTGIRDYIHVVDLAKAHLATLNYLTANPPCLCIFNLGTGQGSSVLQMVRAFEEASGRVIPYEIVKRRTGDIAKLWTSPEYSEKMLGWKAQYNIQKMCEDAWRWQQLNPEGYVA